jgi:hypothetical protein
MQEAPRSAAATGSASPRPSMTSGAQLTIVVGSVVNCVERKK